MISMNDFLETTRFQDPDTGEDFNEAAEAEDDDEEDDEDSEKSLSDALDDLIKSSGEGSRGGKVIGHTRSGKAIYEKKTTRGFRTHAAQHDTKDSKKQKPTDEIYKKDGKYSLVRKKLHDEIVEKRVKDVAPIPPPVGHKPVAIFSAGGTGSGKSGVIHAVKDHFKNSFVHVDSDDIKNDIPEYQKLVAAKDAEAAATVHRESSDLASTLIQKSMKDGKPFIYDGTFSNPERDRKTIEQLREHGYEIHIVFADCEIEEAKRRAAKRAEETGRKVPDDIIEKSHVNSRKALAELQHLVDSAVVYDTMVFPPKIKSSSVAKSESGEKRLINRFLDALKTVKPDLSNDSDYYREEDNGSPIKYEEGK